MTGSAAFAVQAETAVGDVMTIWVLIAAQAVHTVVQLAMAVTADQIAAEAVQRLAD